MLHISYVHTFGNMQEPLPFAESYDYAHDDEASQLLPYARTTFKCVPTTAQDDFVGIGRYASFVLVCVCIWVSDVGGGLHCIVETVLWGMYIYIYTTSQTPQTYTRCIVVVVCVCIWVYIPPQTPHTHTHTHNNTQQ